MGAMLQGEIHACAMEEGGYRGSPNVEAGKVYQHTRSCPCRRDGRRKVWFVKPHDTKYRDKKKGWRAGVKGGKGKDKG